MQEIKIHTEYITLGQALKLAGMTSSGVESKMVIQDGEVKVNAKVETHRGKKLFDGDIFEFNHQSCKVNAHPKS